MSTDTPKIPHYNQLIIYIDRHQGGEDRSFLRALSIDYRFFGVNANILAAMEQVPQLGVGGMRKGNIPITISDLDGGDVSGSGEAWVLGPRAISLSSR